MSKSIYKYNRIIGEEVLAMQTSIHKLMSTIKSEQNVYIQPHNMPDPDAIASKFCSTSSFIVERY